jgi:enoyl-CoA hydratase/carnithine racemase
MYLQTRRRGDIGDDMTEADLVLADRVDGVMTLTLNRPDRMNAWTDDLERRFFDLVDEADDDPAVRAIVVTGAGRGFCPGMDSSVLEQRAAKRSGPTVRERPMTHLLSCRKLTVAAINGGCAGIGLVQALCCDVRFASTNARLSTAFTRRGLAPEFGAGWLLTRLVGAGRATDLILSARVFGAGEAAKMGLVNDAVAPGDLMAVAFDYTRNVVANCSPRAIAYAKADLLADWTRSRADADRDADRIYERPGHAEDFHEGIASFVEKRPPRFEPLGARAG